MTASNLDGSLMGAPNVLDDLRALRLISSSEELIAVSRR